MTSPISPNAKALEYKVGDIGIAVVADGGRTAPVRADFIGNAPLEDVTAALAAANWPTDKLTTTYTPIIIKTGGKNYLIDAGNGPDAIETSNGSAGVLFDSMSKIGMTKDDIDVVVISHFHGDHVNGLWSKGQEVFPNAEIMVPEVEFKFWMDDGEMSRATPGRMTDLFKMNCRLFDPIKNKVIQYAWDKEVAPGVMAVGTPGHSAGHTCFIVSSGGQSVYVQSDITNHVPLFVPHPEWQAGFDQDPEMTVSTRIRVYDMLAAEKMPIQAFHHPFPGRSYVEKAGKGYRLVPVT